MTTRRDIIRNILSTMEDEMPQAVENVDCKNVTQINLFAGSSLNLHFSNVGNQKMNVCNCSEEYYDEIQRKNIYKLCHEIAEKYSLYPQMNKYMHEQWDTKSIFELSDIALRNLLRFMQDKKSKKNGIKN